MKEQDRNLEYFDDLDKLESLKQEYNNIPVPRSRKSTYHVRYPERKNHE